MGSFGGHAIPGSFFFMIGFWQIVQIFKRYRHCRKLKEDFVSSTWYPCLCCCGRTKEFPWESCVKILLACIGMIIESCTANYDNGIISDPGNEQHITMYLAFGVNGILETLTYFGLTFSPFVDHVSLAFAFMMEYILFHFHLHGREDIDVLVHTLLLYVILLSVFSMIYMMRFRNHVLAAVLGAYSFLLQGTWFWQVGFILYNPLPNAVKWNSEDHENIMIVACYFAWHCGVLLIGVIFIGSLSMKCDRNDYSALDAEDNVSLLSTFNEKDSLKNYKPLEYGSEDFKYEDDDL